MTCDLRQQAHQVAFQFPLEKLLHKKIIVDAVTVLRNDAGYGLSMGLVN